MNTSFGPHAAPGAYVCVYRHFQPSPRALRDTQIVAASDPALSAFIASYLQGNSYFDWGDDPSFFAAQRFQGSAAHAAWGVCRPNVRGVLCPGDVVVFFCATRQSQLSPTTDYFFVGVGAVGEVVHDRKRIWTRPQYRLYREHYNVLAKYTLRGPVQHETFHPYHEDWLHRLASPYVLFSPSESFFNVHSPLHVATSTDGAREVWRSGLNRRVARLEAILFKSLGIPRRLRTSPTGTAHPHINLTHRLSQHGTTAPALRRALLPLV